MVLLLAEFFSEARGIMFYGLPASHLGMQFSCQVKAGNPYDVDSIAIMTSYGMLGHLAREASRCLAPLLRAGIQASGLALMLTYCMVIVNFICRQVTFLPYTRGGYSAGAYGGRVVHQSHRERRN